MIRLNEDKYLYNYTIDENGTIRDDEGVIQEVKLRQGRYFFFKGYAVHRILMYTYNGWRNGHKWHIHHIDCNSKNNNLENLIYLTRAEHNSIHKKDNHYRLGHHHSSTSKMKMSEVKRGKYKGELNPMYGKKGINSPLYGIKFSEEHKRKISESLKGKHFSEEHKRKIGEIHKGNCYNKGRIFVNNGIVSKMVYPDQIPEGFIKGILK